jgi:hypothetical protein
MSTICGHNKGSGLTDGGKYADTVLEQSYSRNITESITSQSSIDKGVIAQTIVLAKEQSTNKSLGTVIVSILTPAKSTTEHLIIPELLGGVKSYDHLPSGWENVEVIADLAMA